ncbi:MAG TPA: ABC transporter permease [Thermoanaerobaculia bacterium]|nr:ABC transporter permease [Thermoanaerobaculia bacterium]
MLDTLRQDTEFGLRRLAKNPLFTATAALVLGLGIGANTAVYSVVRAVLLRPLPYPEAGRIMLISESNRAKGFSLFGVSSPDLRDWIERSRAFERMAAFTTSGANLAGREAPERVRLASVTPGFFPVLGVRAQLGRVFPSEREARESEDVVVISARLWRARFAAAPDVVGRAIRLGGRAHLVIGVAGDELRFPENVDIWKPLLLERDSSGRGARWLSALGRLRPGVSREQGLAEVNAIEQDLARQYPDPDRGWSVDVLALRDAMVQDARPGLLLLLGAVGLVLLIACVNVATLLLAQATGRTKEIATRLALGATRSRLVRQLAIENGLLGIAGGTLGMVLGGVMFRALLWISPAMTPRRGEIGLDAVVLAAGVLSGLVASVLAGLAPAYEAGRQDIRSKLVAGTASAGGRTARLRAALVVGELALAIVLLVGAGLLLRSVSRVLSIRPGFDPRGVLAFRIAPPQSAPAAADTQETFLAKYRAERGRMAGFYESAAAELRSLPGVESAGAINRLPLTGDWWTDELAVEGRPVARGEELSPKARVVTPGYFATLHLPLLDGRDVSAGDTAASPRVALVNETLARLLWNKEDPKGRRVCLCHDPGPNAPWLTVVGVVGDVRQTSLTLPAEPTVYVPFAQAMTGLFPDWGMDLVVRTRTSPLALAGAVRSAFRTLDGSLAVFDIRTLETVVANTVEQERFLLLLLSAFAGVALFLAAVGIYGVMSYLVVARTREIGIRIALGAQAEGILWLVTRRAASLSIAGVLLGTAAALALTRTMTSLLHGVAPWDPATFAGVAAVALLAAAGAGWLPACRAIRVDPIVALSHE